MHQAEEILPSLRVKPTAFTDTAVWFPDFTRRHRTDSQRFRKIKSTILKDEIKLCDNCYPRSRNTAGFERSNRQRVKWWRVRNQLSISVSAAQRFGVFLFQGQCVARSIEGLVPGPVLFYRIAHCALRQSGGGRGGEGGGGGGPVPAVATPAANLPPGHTHTHTKWNREALDANAGHGWIRTTQAQPGLCYTGMQRHTHTNTHTQTHSELL